MSTTGGVLGEDPYNTDHRDSKHTQKGTSVRSQRVVLVIVGLEDSCAVVLEAKKQSETAPKHQGSKTLPNNDLRGFDWHS